MRAGFTQRRNEVTMRRSAASDSRLVIPTWTANTLTVTSIDIAALFYSPVDFTDAPDLHQTVVKFIG